MLCRLQVCALVCLIVSAMATAEDWPNWRGPRQDGTSRETPLPLQWSDTDGLAWKCKLPEYGNSTPAIWGESIFITTHVDDKDLLLLKISKATGQTVWTRRVGTGSAERVATGEKSGGHRGTQRFHKDQNLASASVVTDGEVAIAHFGNGDLAAYDYAGNKLWAHDLQAEHGKYTIWWGHANSPVLAGDVVVSVCMQDPCSDLGGRTSPSYVVAHDKRTGREQWKVLRPTPSLGEHGDAYTTPLLWQSPKGQTELVVMGGETLDAYDPATGRRLWWLDGLEGNRVITGPVAAGGVLYTARGMRGPLLAVRPSDAGARSQSDVLWQYDRETPDTPVPVVWNNLLFMITDNGIAKCLDCTKGELLWQERLKGRFRASPLAADGRVYFVNMEGVTTVTAASGTYTKLAENRLDDIVLASPAVSDGRIYIRGQKYLYAIGP